MKRYAILLLSGMFILSIVILSGSVSVAREKAAREDLVRNAYQQIRTAADKNGDGKISMDECMAISRDKKKIVKDCKYWDADGNGVITEDEYVKQVKKILR
jgi:Ca2+-binding EF-hand superfamily protein